MRYTADNVSCNLSGSHRFLLITQLPKRFAYLALSTGLFT